MLRFKLVGQDDVVRGETHVQVIQDLQTRWRLGSESDSVELHLERLVSAVGRFFAATVTLPDGSEEDRCRAFLERACELGLLNPIVKKGRTS